MSLARRHRLLLLSIMFLVLTILAISQITL